MELLLRVTPTDGQPRDVVVAADPDAQIGALADSLAIFLGLGLAPNSHNVFLEATAQRIDPAATLEKSRLVSGDSLIIGARPERAPRLHPELETDQLSLAVLAGPEAGRVYPLTPGQHLAGRGPEATIPIEDPTIPRRAFGFHLAPDGSALVVPEPSGPSGPNGQRSGQGSGPNDVLVDGRPLDRARRVDDGSVIHTGATVLSVRRSAPVPAEPTDRLGSIPYHRTPYRPSIVAERAFPVLEGIPARPEPRRLPVLGSLAPVAGGVALYAFSRQPEFLALLALTPVTMGASWLEERRAGGRKYQREVARFREQLGTRRGEAEAAVHAERLERLRAAPDAAELARRAGLRGVGLWPRGRGDADFLNLRLGLGDVASRVRCPVATSGESDLRAEAAAALGGHDRLSSAPIVVPAGDLGTLAICGSGNVVTSAAASLVVQAATLHSPEDLVVFAALRRDHRLAHHIAWLPHTRSLSSPLATRHVVTSAEAGRALCSQLAAVAERRLEVRDDGTDRRWPRLLLVLDEALDLDPAVVGRLLDLAQPAGLTALWLGTSEARVPRQAQAVLRCVPSDHGPSELWFRDPSKAVMSLEVETLPPEVVDPAVRSLSPLRDASSSNVTSAIPRVVPLFAALGLEEPLGADREESHPPLSRSIVERWLADAGNALEAPLGLTAGGVMSIDLVADGPHALIGGTSGSGKSELLVALVAGLIAQHPPSRLNLLFVDYKGGAASSVYRTAPHTVGYVTNLNGDLANRALVSLRAELDRRMRLMEGRAKDLKEMRERHPGDAPPSLVIVVDEFATLIKEIPEFVPGIIDVAQRGRSLGIHLILATQRPSGAVNENILANTNARLCLRMIDGADSSAIIGAPDAATIPVPLRGRGFARLGPGELMPFQAAYGGAPFGRGGGGQLQIAEFLSDRPLAPPGAIPAGGSTSTQLHALLAAVGEAAESLQVPTPRAPWLDELPALVPLAVVLRGFRQSGHRWLLPIGEYDDPAHQRQDTVLVDLEDGGGLLVFGAVASGKTTALRTLAAAAVSAPPGGGVVVFGIDFASRALRSLEQLPQCAAVACGDDLEAVTRVLALLEQEVERRRALLAGAESLTAHLASGGAELPRVLLLVDGYTAMRDVFTREGATAAMHGWMERFHRLLAEGRQVGVHAVVTADRPGAVAPALAALIGRRLILRQVDDRVYVELGVASSRARGLELGPGRGLLDAGLLVQVACTSGPATDGASQAAQLGVLGRREAAGPAGVPAVLRSTALSEAEPLPPVVGAEGRRNGQHGWLATLGVADVTYEPVTLDLSDGHLLIAGPGKSGRTTALRALLASLDAGADVYVAGAASSPLRRDRSWDRAAFASPEAIGELVAELAQLSSAYPDSPRLLFIDDADRLLEDTALAAALDPLARAESVRIVATVETHSLTSGYFASALMQQLKKVRRRLLLQPLDDAEIFTVLGVRYPLRPELAMPPGRGILLAGRRPRIVQVGLAEAAVREASPAGGAASRGAARGPRASQRPVVARPR